jgi:lipopolysaccharide transport system ATP-binding protein
MSDNAIEIENLSKMYFLAGRRGPSTSLRQSLAMLWRGERKDNFDDEIAAGHAFWAVKDVNLVLRRGDVLGIIGRNGAGKSTLLKILSRVTAPTTGRAVIRGSVVSLLEVGTGFHDELTGRENIYLNAAILGMPRAEIDRKFDEIVAFSGVERFLDSPVKHYSSGMRVRLGFSVAANIEPDILIIDEVLAVGDLAFQEKCLQKMNALTGDRQRTVLFVSHSMASIANFCPRSIRLDQGRIVDDGPSGEVISRYHLTERRTSGTSLEHRRDRLGSGLLRFTNVHLEDPGGRRVLHARTGEPIVFVLEYECDPDFTGPCDALVNVVLSNSKGARLFGMPTDAMRQTRVALHERGRLICHLSEVPLLPGSYEMDIGCIRDRELVDKVVGAATLTVVEGDPYKTGALPHANFGDVVVRYSWAYEPTLELGTVVAGDKALRLAADKP